MAAQARQDAPAPAAPVVWDLSEIFATLGHPDDAHGMVVLPLDGQEAFVRARPLAFRPVPGGWGERGATHVVLAEADEAAVHDALAMAWRKAAPKSLLELHPFDGA